MKAERKQSKALGFSEKVYRFLLMAYPAEHRQEYGAAMVQLFRDQCRDASREAGLRGLVMLWCRTLLDLVKTATLERLATIKGKEFMFKKRFMEISSRREVQLKVFVISLFVCLLVVGVSVFINSLLPEVYVSTARLALSSGNSYDPHFVQTQFEIIQSEVILDKVIENLDLNEVWGKKYLNGTRLGIAESRIFLKSHLYLRSARNSSSLIEIQAFSDDRNEAAKIANETAMAYRDYWSKKDNEQLSGYAFKNNELSKIQPVQIIDRAEQSIRPVRPNRTLNYAISIIIGPVAGAVAGFSFLIVAALRKPKAMA